MKRQPSVPEYSFVQQNICSKYKTNLRNHPSSNPTKEATAKHDRDILPQNTIRFKFFVKLLKDIYSWVNNQTKLCYFVIVLPLFGGRNQNNLINSLRILMSNFIVQTHTQNKRSTKCTT